MNTICLSTLNCKIHLTLKLTWRLTSIDVFWRSESDCETTHVVENSSLLTSDATVWKFESRFDFRFFSSRNLISVFYLKK